MLSNIANYLFGGRADDVEQREVDNAGDNVEEKDWVFVEKTPATDKEKEQWLVTPPPCFTGSSAEVLSSSPLENLLIEHPSMSVYHSLHEGDPMRGGEEGSAAAPPAPEVVPPPAAQALEPPAPADAAQPAVHRAPAGRVCPKVPNVAKAVARAERGKKRREHKSKSKGVIARANKVYVEKQVGSLRTKPKKINQPSF